MSSLPTRAEILCLSSLSAALVDREQKKRDAELRNHFNIGESWRYFHDPTLAANSSDGQKRHQELNKALEKLDKSGFQRNYHQMIMHKAYTVASLKWIYRKDLKANLVRLIRDMQIEEMKSNVIVLTPRRYGKTTSVALYVAAFIMTQGAISGETDIEVSIYSTGRRASKKLLTLIWKMCSILADNSTDFCLEFNQETLRVKCLNGGTCLVGSYPSKEQVRSLSCVRAVFCVLEISHQERWPRRVVLLCATSVLVEGSR